MTRILPLSPSSLAGVIVLTVGGLCMSLSSIFPWLIEFPQSWSLPMNEWIGVSLTWLFELIKPAVRMISLVLSYPMTGMNKVLTSVPWQIAIGATVALGWYIGGWRMALLGLTGLGFVLASGYWIEGMNTLALVGVSVPLALVAGGVMGVVAYEFARIRNALQTILDIMQTVPTFAYLTPLLLLFGFGPVVGLIASAIYAAPPTARNVLLGLERVDPEIKEAAVMSGSTRMQQLFLVELPAAKRQIMIGINQSLMAALSMVIIAAVIGGFDDIGWEVLLTMRKAQFGESLLAGLVIVAFAILMDRMSAHMIEERERFDVRISLGIFALAFLVWLVGSEQLPNASEFAMLDRVAAWVDTGLGDFTAAQGVRLDGIKNGAMFYGLLPLRIGLDEAVLPFTWGFQWDARMSALLLGVAIAIALVLAWRGWTLAGTGLVLAVGMLETGIAHLPWPFVLAGASALGWIAGGRKLALYAFLMLLAILVSGLWERALLSLYLCSAAVFACAVVGGCIGLLCAISPMAWRIVQPVCDMLQTIPLFVFLIPVLMFFQIGEFSAFLAICFYAIVPMIRYTRHGLVETPTELLEAARASGATRWQILRDIRAPYAAPTILLGLNQTILYAFVMLVIAALIGTTGLGQSIYLALGQADVGLGISAGAAMAILALVADRLVQGFTRSKQEALGL